MEESCPSKSDMQIFNINRKIQVKIRKREKKKKKRQKTSSKDLTNREKTTENTVRPEKMAATILKEKKVFLPFSPSRLAKIYLDILMEKLKGDYREKVSIKNEKLAQKIRVKRKDDKICQDNVNTQI